MQRCKCIIPASACMHGMAPPAWRQEAAGGAAWLVRPQQALRMLPSPSRVVITALRAQIWLIVLHERAGGHPAAPRGFVHALRAAAPPPGLAASAAPPGSMAGSSRARQLEKLLIVHHCAPWIISGRRARERSSAWRSVMCLGCHWRPGSTMMSWIWTSVAGCLDRPDVQGPVEEEAQSALVMSHWSHIQLLLMLCI
jgi:hypothetical protein